MHAMIQPGETPAPIDSAGALSWPGRRVRRALPTEDGQAAGAAENLICSAMNLVKHAWLVYLTLGVLAIAAAVVGEVYKVDWVTNWLAPILLLLCWVSHSALANRPDVTARTRAGKRASYAKTTAFAALIFLFIMIEVESDAPVTLRLMGLSMTTSAYAASRFLVITGLVLGAVGVWMTMSQVRRETAAAELAKGASGQSPPAPAAGPNP